MTGLHDPLILAGLGCAAFGYLLAVYLLLRSGR